MGLKQYQEVPEVKEIVFVEELVDLMPMYLKNVQTDFSRLKEAASTRDFTEMERVSHRVKGSAASYGFDNIDAIMANIQLAAKNEDLQVAVEQVQKFSSVLQMIEDKLKTIEG